ncbi:MAG TPA: RHS repeat-associated core domain-containing protein, partial [Candidatus Paceibacterota bacterium]|nr:RHS repeat-associated core domain-containing protein [Candidatus Paceibacterota bacterium]
GRRIGKTVKAWSGTSYTNVYVLKFLYDGWNLVAELDANNNVVRSYLWGTDISGSYQGAGGVGGLLAVNVATNGVHFPAYDGNGNIAGLVSASSGAITARYEYGPFAEPIRVSGPIAKAVPLRFSTKYLDGETGLYYYGYRYYNSSMGRWPNRDPIEEWGGVNLYACVINNPISYVDTDGMQLFPPVLIEAPPVLIPRPILEPIVRPGPGIPPEWLPIPAPRPVPTPPGGGTMPPLSPPVPIIPPQPGNPNPTPDPSPNLSPQPQPNPGQNAPPQTVTQDCGEWLCRMGKNWETKEQLTKGPTGAEAAKAAGYGYGVSVLLFSKPPATASCAPKFMLEAAFPVRKTGAKPNHYTVIFAEPLTDLEADRFNRTIRRTPPPPPPPRRYPPSTIIAVILVY